MIIEILRKLDFEIQDDGDSTYKIILLRPESCPTCGSNVVSVGYTKPRKILDMVNDEFETISIRHSRYRCKNKACSQYCYFDDKKRLDRVLGPGNKIFKLAKSGLVRARLQHPTWSFQEVADHLNIGVSTIFQSYKKVRDKYWNKYFAPQPLMFVDQIVVEIKHKGKDWFCVFGSIDNDICLTTIVPSNDIDGFLKFYDKLYSGEYSPYKTDIIWHISCRRMAQLLTQYADQTFVIEVEDYSDYCQCLCNKLGDDVNAHLRQNSAPYNKELVDKMVEDILLMLDHHISSQEIVFMLCFSSNVTREALSQSDIWRRYL